MKSPNVSRMIPRATILDRIEQNRIDLRFNEIYPFQIENQT